MNPELIRQHEEHKARRQRMSANGKQDDPEVSIRNAAAARDAEMGKLAAEYRAEELRQRLARCERMRRNRARKKLALE